MTEERATELEREVFEAITGWPLDEAPDGGVDEDTAAWLATARTAIPVVAEHIAQQIEAAKDHHYPPRDSGLREAARIAREAGNA